MKTFGIHTQANPSWGSTTRGVRVIVAATSRAKAVEAMKAAGLRNMTVNFLATYGMTTGNPTEVAAAEAAPGTVFWAEDRPGAPYHPVEV